MRHRSVAAAPLDRDIKLIGRGHQRPGASGDQPVLGIGHDVQRKSRFGQRQIGSAAQKTVTQHMPRAVKAFFARLEHEAHFALQRCGPRAEQLRGARQHRGVGVVAASVHGSGNRRGKVESGFLRHWQRVHIAAQQHAAPRPGSAFQRSEQPGGRWARDPFQRKVRQCSLDLVAGQWSVEPQLRLGMDRAAQGDDIARECAGLFEQAFMQHLGLRSGWRFFGPQHCASRPRSQAGR